MLNYNIQDHVKGDTFNELPFQISKNGLPIDLNGVEIRMQLRLNPSHPTGYILSVQGEQIEITDAAGGKFSIKEQVIDIPSGNYVYDMEFAFADNVVKTYIGGHWNILQDITR